MNRQLKIELVKYIKTVLYVLVKKLSLVQGGVMSPLPLFKSTTALWSPYSSPVDLWLWSYFPSTPMELKDSIQQIASDIHPDILHSAVTGVVTRLTCSIQCGGGHVNKFSFNKSLKVYNCIRIMILLITF